MSHLAPPPPTHPWAPVGGHRPQVRNSQWWLHEDSLLRCASSRGLPAQSCGIRFTLSSPCCRRRMWWCHKPLGQRGFVRATLLSAWLKRAKVSGERGVQTANLPSLFYLLTSASCLQLSKAPSSDACCSSGSSLQKTGSCLGDQHVRQEPLAFHWVVLWKRNGWQQEITTQTNINIQTAASLKLTVSEMGSFHNNRYHICESQLSSSLHIMLEPSDLLTSGANLTAALKSHSNILQGLRSAAEDTWCQSRLDLTLSYSVLKFGCLK